MGNWLSLLGFVLTGVAGAKSARDTGNANQALNNYNAQVSELKANDALARGRDAVIQHRLRTRQLIGSQRAAFAASGVDISDADSTAQNVFSDTQELSEQDALVIKTNAAREAWGFRAEGRDFRLRGSIARREGDDRALGTLVSTAGTALYTKYGFRGN